MKDFFWPSARAATLGIYFILAGCATSEWEAAKRLDFTPEILQQASSLLAADPELGQQSVLVDGFKGDMRLKGSVSTEAQRSRAERLVWAVRGVRSVTNQLEIKAPARK